MTIRRRLRFRGAVQGVGFRPTLYRLAIAHGLAGWVVNDPAGATAEVEGPAVVVEAFLAALPAALPPLARLDAMDIESVEPSGEHSFRVESTQQGRRTGALVPPDAAVCADCRREMEGHGDRRHHYAFTTCTNCGPRFSLVLDLPYDRERTSMACFPLCPDCRREYEDPSDRRFHAEPVCCPVCGPTLRLVHGNGEPAAEGSRAIAAARHALAEDRIVAVKALGGFQLACRADDPSAVAELRRRKSRPSKPFAVMVRDLAAARCLVVLSAADEALLLSPRSPVLLTPIRSGAQIAPGIAPGLGDLGVMLPTTPLHLELMCDPDVPPLVMTSGNQADEPICRTNREALARLGDVADLLLLHDRDVVRRVDDSVLRSAGGGPFMIRRARGWVPEPLPLPVSAPVPVLAVGGHLQATSCLATGDQAFVSQHVGDLDGDPARAFLREVIVSLERFLAVEASVIVADGHPDYPSHWYAVELARGRGGRVIEVQHHLAHAAAVLAEHDRFPHSGQASRALILDGTGWGPDGDAWGGEWLEIDGDLRWRRLAHLEPLPLVGGERAVKEPWRVAAAAIALAGGSHLVERTPMAAMVPVSELRQIDRLAAASSWPRATGAGRVFEACGALLGLALCNGWEGEAAARLEASAAAHGPAAPWPEVRLAAASKPLRLPSSRLLRAAAERAATGEHVGRVAAGFHATFVRLAVEITARLGIPTGSAIALGGGCLVNRILRAGLAGSLEDLGLEGLLPQLLPAGDGGLSYGQAVLAAAALARGLELSLEPTPRPGV